MTMALDTIPDWTSHLNDAIAAARVQTQVRVDPVGIALVWHAGRWAMYSADAWERPEEHGLLPWVPPPGKAVVVVQADGSWSNL